MTEQMLIADKSRSYYGATTERSITVASIVVPKGFRSIGIGRGYAHLFEHMIIKSNQDYFDYLEEQGVNYNAETQENQILFTFIDFDKGVLKNEARNLKKLFDKEFLEDDLEKEKKVIEQEYVYLRQRFSKESVDESVGTPEEIRAFSLNELNRYKSELTKDHKIFFIDRKPENIIDDMTKLENVYIDDEWYKNVIISDTFLNDGKIVLRVENSIYAQLLIYNLRILCNYSLNKAEFKVTQNGDKYTLEILDNKESLMMKLYDKRKAFARYVLLLDTIKIYYQELAYCISNIGENFETEKCYFSNWEDCIIENIKE